MQVNAPLETQVRSVIAEVLDLDEDELPEDPSQETMPRWSSLTHLVLVLSLEERFEVAFSMEEMLTMTSAERILDILGRRV
jgi:acyl carrier protein